MSEILKEIHYAESKVKLDKSNTENSKKKIENYYKDIFSQYQITDQAFYNSMDYYYSVPDTLNLIYSMIIAQMSKDQSILNAKLNQD